LTNKNVFLTFSTGKSTRQSRQIERIEIKMIKTVLSLS
jgi:hypothetical protein